MKVYRNIFGVLVSFTMLIALSSCVEQLDEYVNELTDYVVFKAALDSEVSSLPTKGYSGCLDYVEEEWPINFGSEVETKVDLYKSLNEIKTAGVYGYIYSEEWSNNELIINRRKYVFDGDQMDGEDPIKWSEIDKDVSERTFRAFVYAPFDAAVMPAADGKSTIGTPVITVDKGAPVITVEDVTKAQKDIVVADGLTTIKSDKSHRKKLSLDFEHIFTAVQFKAGFDCKITGISITDIKTAGEYVIGTGWTLSETLVSYSVTIPGEGLTVSSGSNIGTTILMLPQTFGSGSEISLTYQDDSGLKTMTASLSGVEWRPGKNITYTLMKDSEREYIYFDLAAGNIEITNDSYTGYVFVNNGNGTIEAKKITGKRVEKQKYYVYQSCTTDKNKWEDDSKTKISKNYMAAWGGYSESDKKATITPADGFPSYDPVEGPDKRLWSDYITNNTNVIEVIEAWDNAAGAGQASDRYINSDAVNGGNGETPLGAVRNAKRDATKNRIHINGNIGNVTMMIDNLYSSYQERKGATASLSDPPVRGRTKGGISFLPSQKGTASVLTIHIIGDNRFGCINYQNHNKNNNWLKFEGSGSLTVGDTDYYKDKNGLGSNRSCSVIGGYDEPASNENVFNIEFNSGVIYAGATTSACTAIGGGGNGDTNIVINGGTITAVAKTTGTAIGGGTGLSKPGGAGQVTINGGNVYAYNFANTSNVPSAAIGAAGSQSAPGGDGVVTITGGYVYAQSDYGTAIGGGSSAWNRAGKGEITITGGTVIAKTGDPRSLNPKIEADISVGIGGGSAYTQKYDTKTYAEKYPDEDEPELYTDNGGAAIIKISGNPVVRTGSVGGGTPGFGAKGGRNGKIGSANISIRGGDIQAQFVLADSPTNTSNVSNTFVMNDGLIRNSSTSDSEYFCIKPNGGAVYMEKGTFTMTGGTIKECSADKADAEGGAKGGAVYIEGDSETSFKMTGGSILNCKADTDGGAIYLKGGKVEITGGKIEGNVAYNGNGGAVSVLGGNFTMNGDNVLITKNAAFGSGNKGNGGGIYVAPVSEDSDDEINVYLTKGNITSNSADRNGGGVCIDMGSNNSADLTVMVGAEAQVEGQSAEATPSIKLNTALNKGGGMYVRVADADDSSLTSSHVTLHDGYIKENSTSSYEVNPEVAVEGGLVTLMNEGITKQVTITFKNNAQYFAKGETDDEAVQFVVAAASSKLTSRRYLIPRDGDGFEESPSARYTEFNGWNTRRDGTGTRLDDKPGNYTDADVCSFEEDITLYAQWKEK